MRAPQITSAIIAEIEGITRWYLTTAFGRWEGPGTVPFYADPRRIGPFAVDVDALAARDADALFKVLITMAAYQARRDVDVMEIQRTMRPSRARELTSPHRLRVLVERSPCAHLRNAEDFDRRCDVRRDLAREGATCGTRPRTPCHVKDATLAIGCRRPRSLRLASHEFAASDLSQLSSGTACSAASRLSVPTSLETVPPRYLCTGGRRMVPKRAQATPSSWSRGPCRGRAQAA